MALTVLQSVLDIIDNGIVNGIDHIAISIDVAMALDMINFSIIVNGIGSIAKGTDTTAWDIIDNHIINNIIADCNTVNIINDITDFMSNAVVT